MSEKPLMALLAIYPNRSYAMNAVTYLSRLEKSNQFQADELAIVTKDLSGKVTVDEVRHPTGKRGAKRGVAIGAVVGLVFPVGLAGAAIAGTAVGGLTGHLRGQSLAHHGLRAMGEQLERGHSGVIVIVDDEAVEETARRLTGYESLHRQIIDPQTLAPESEATED
jgi:uncharacterized membrane protein